MNDDEVFELYKSLGENVAKINDTDEFESFILGLQRRLNAGFGVARTPESLMVNLIEVMRDWRDHGVRFVNGQLTAERMQVIAGALWCAAAKD